MHKECLPKEGWAVLEGIKDACTKYDMTLAGGTALALHLGHRISVDLDFFTGMHFYVESVVSDIRKANIPFQIISDGEGYLIATIAGIKFSLFKYDYPFLEAPISCEGIHVAGVLDIASMKVIAISQRGTKRDFADLYFILQEIPFHRISDFMVKRFGKERLSPLHIGKSFVYFSDADSNPDPDFIKGREVSWEKVKGFFKRHVRQFVLDLDSALKGKD